jgi:hypothetical protein
MMTPANKANKKIPKLNSLIGLIPLLFVFGDIILVILLCIVPDTTVTFPIVLVIVVPDFPLLSSHRNLPYYPVT